MRANLSIDAFSIVVATREQSCAHGNTLEVLSEVEDVIPELEDLNIWVRLHHWVQELFGFHHEIVDALLHALVFGAAGDLKRNNDDKVRSDTMVCAPWCLYRPGSLAAHPAHHCPRQTPTQTPRLCHRADRPAS